MNNNILLFIILFIFCIIFLKYFDFNNIFKNILFLFYEKEYFNNRLVPNKIFKHNNKIYVLDTKNILENNKNPLIFNSFEDYKKFISTLENELQTEFSYIKNYNNIKNNIKHNIKNNIKNNIKDNEDITKENKCSKFASECILNNDSPFLDNIYNIKNLKELDKKCNKTVFKKEFCKELEELYKNDKKYKKLCNKEPNNKICKKLNLIKYDTKNLSDVCLNKKKDYDGFKKLCLLEDFFKENMLLYDF